MKSILVIGMGRFGHHLTKNLLELGNDVMIVDSEENRMEDLVPYATSAKIGDCTNPEVLRSLGVANFDLIFICIGTNFQSSLEITSLVKEMGGRHVVSKATRDIQAKFIDRPGLRSNFPRPIITAGIFLHRLQKRLANRIHENTP